ncbi:MAG TPA: flagellar basal body protein, partial [Sphingomonas sp.]
MNDMLSIGASGVRAYQTALGVVSDNIANAGTVGYSRRAAQLAEIAPAGAIGLAARVGIPGNGVVVQGIERSADAYKTSAVRIASTDLARSETGIAWMNRVQSVLTQGSVPARMTSFFAAAQSLAADPTSSSTRAAMLEAGATTAAAFRTTGAALDAAAAELDQTAASGVRQLATLGLAMARINDGLGRAVPGSTAAAALSDDRDQLLEQMSTLTDVSVQLDTA